MQRTVDQSLEEIDAVLLVLRRERIGAGDRTPPSGCSRWACRS
jgi:hypothetical protein